MQKSFSAILLAAGQGTRLRPYTLSTPKCLVPINGVPLLDIWIDQLISCHGLTEILINTSFLADTVQNHIAQHRNKDKIKIFYEPKLLGTAGTIKLLSNYTKEQNIFIAHADNLTKFNINDFFSFHLNRPNQCQITMMTFDPEDSKSCGIVGLNQERIVTSYDEKPLVDMKGEANAAVYFFDKSCFNEINKMDSVFDLSRDVLPFFIGKIVAWKNSIYHRDIGTPDSYQKGQREFSNLMNKNFGTK